MDPLNLTKHEYDLYLNDFYQKKSNQFEAVKGQTDPFSHTVIETWDDYMRFAQCSILKSHAERSLSDIEQEYKSKLKDSYKRLDTYARKNRDLSNSIIGLEAKNQTLQKTVQEKTKSTRRSRIFSRALILLLVCLVLFFPSRYPDKVISDLSAQNADLQDQLDAANLQIEELSASVDQSYWNGFVSGSKSPSGSTSSRNSSGSSHSWESEAYVESTYIGNSSSKKFHRSSCSYLPSKSNQVPLSSREEAIRSGYDPCKRCDP